MIWADTVLSEATFTAVQGHDLLAGYRAMGGAVGAGLTVARTIINHNVISTGGTPSLTTSVRVGLIAEAAAGEAEIPDPVAEPYADWAWNSRYYVPIATSLTASNSLVQIDTSVQRKIDELGQSYWLMLSPELGGATNLTYSAHVRVLLRLP